MSVPKAHKVLLEITPGPGPIDEVERIADSCRAFGSSLGHPFEISLSSAREATVSVVVPMLNEEANLPALYERLAKVLGSSGLSYELVLVDDGSTDGTGAEILRLRQEDPRVKYIRLARNFGHQAALTAGLAHARGEAVIAIDADLQDPPEVITELLARWDEGFDVAYAVRRHRKEPVAKRIAYALFYRLLHRVAAVDIPLDAGDFCLMDRRVVDQLNALPERNRFLRGLRTWVGFRQIGVEYERQVRHAGNTQYSFWKLVRLAVDGLVSFSYIPLRVSSTVGFVVSLGSLVAGLYYLILRLAGHRDPAGFAGIIVAVLFLGGVQLITIGIMGEYVGRIFDEVKDRPTYIVSELEGFDT